MMFTAFKDLAKAYMDGRSVHVFEANMDWEADYLEL